MNTLKKTQQALPNNIATDFINILVYNNMNLKNLEGQDFIDSFRKNFICVNNARYFDYDFENNLIKFWKFIIKDNYYFTLKINFHFDFNKFKSTGQIDSLTPTLEVDREYYIHDSNDNLYAIVAPPLENIPNFNPFIANVFYSITDELFSYFTKYFAMKYSTIIIKRNELVEKNLLDDNRIESLLYDILCDYTRIIK